jgi:ribosomal protein S18 acetylase RimI-like enzyme
MGPVSGTDDDIVVEVLTEARAEQLADELLAMTADAAWDDWDRQNLLSGRPEKWALSLLALDDGRPVGWAIASRTADSVHLHHLVVAPQRRSAGIGSLLVQQLLRSSGPAPLTLKVHPGNEPAARFYRRLGFRETGAAPSGYLCFTSEATGDEAGGPT